MLQKRRLTYKQWADRLLTLNFISWEYSLYFDPDLCWLLTLLKSTSFYGIGTDSYSLIIASTNSSWSRAVESSSISQNRGDITSSRSGASWEMSIAWGDILPSLSLSRTLKIYVKICTCFVFIIFSVFLLVYTVLDFWACSKLAWS